MLLVGIVRRPHGLTGEVAVEVFTDFPERFVPGLRLHWQKGSRQRTLAVTGVRPQVRRMLLSFAGVQDAEAAADLSGGELLIADEEAVPAPPGFYYSHEIEGWRCEDASGSYLGAVSRLEQTIAGPMLRMRTSGQREVLVPFVRPIVIAVEPEAQRIVLAPPEGLLDL